MALPTGHHGPLFICCNDCRCRRPSGSTYGCGCCRRSRSSTDDYCWYYRNGSGVLGNGFGAGLILEGWSIDWFLRFFPRSFSRSTPGEFGMMYSAKWPFVICFDDFVCKICFVCRTYLYPFLCLCDGIWVSSVRFACGRSILLGLIFLIYKHRFHSWKCWHSNSERLSLAFDVHCHQMCLMYCWAKEVPWLHALKACLILGLLMTAHQFFQSVISNMHLYICCASV